MTNHTNLIARLSNGWVTRPKRWSGDTHHDFPYGSLDDEATDLLMKEAADALEALQAEVKHLNLHLKATQIGRGATLARLAITEEANSMLLARNKWLEHVVADERDSALARLAELAKQEPVIYQAKTKPGFLSTSVYAWEDCEKADFLVYEADGVHVRGLYAAAGASPVEPSQAQPEPVNVKLVELLEPAFTEIQHVLGSTLEVPYQRKSLETALELVRAAIAVIKQSQPDYEAMHKKGFQAFDCPVCGFDGALGFQPAAQPSQALELSDEEIDNLWVKEFVGQPFYTRRIAYARAVIAAINAKEQS